MPGDEETGKGRSERGASTSGWHVRSTVEWAIDFFFCTALYYLCRLRFLFGLAADSLLYNAVRCALHCVVGLCRLRFVCGLFSNSVCFCTNAAQEMRCEGLIFHARSPRASQRCLVVFFRLRFFYGLSANSLCCRSYAAQGMQRLDLPCAKPSRFSAHMNVAKSGSSAFCSGSFTMISAFSFMAW